jgi:alkylation response protein AidB-like acyl-CoA dehydrogenase
LTVIYPDDFRGARVQSRTLITTARNLIPTLKEREEEAERHRRLPEATSLDLRRTGIARLLQPESFGGAEGSLEHLVDVLVPIASGCPSTAWCLAQYLFHNYMIARWLVEAQKEVWSDPTNLVSGVQASDWCILAGWWSRIPPPTRCAIS